MNYEVLERIGLTKAEVKVYTTLLKLGESPSGNIVRESDLIKSTVYESIRRLEEKGLVSFVLKNNIKYFQAAQVERILEFVEDKKRELDDTHKEAQELVEKMKVDFGSLKPQAQAQVLVGIEGFKTMRRDVLKNSNGEHLLIGAISREDEIIPGYFKDWNKKRQKERIKMRILHKESAREKQMANKEFMGENFETRFLPSEVESPAVINVYGDRVVNVLWQDNYPICFMLINKEIADSYRNYFEYLWKISKK